MLRLIPNEEPEVAAIDNVVSLHPIAELNIVELDNIFEIVPHVGAAAVEPCVDGVCSISWKPQRPSAA